MATSTDQNQGASDVNAAHLVEVPMTSDKAKFLTGILQNSYLDASYVSGTLSVISIQTIHNAGLELRYLNKRNEMQAMNRSRVELKEVFGFTVARKSNVFLNKVVSNGLKVQETSYNAFGDSSKGLYVSKHCDVMLKFAENHHDQYRYLRILVHRLIPGKLLSTNHGTNKLPPTETFDGHIALTRPAIGNDILVQVMLSQIYIYELDKQNIPVEYPRQCLPYAVFTFERKVESTMPASIVPPQIVQQQPTKHVTKDNVIVLQKASDLQSQQQPKKLPLTTFHSKVPCSSTAISGGAVTVRGTLTNNAFQTLNAITIQPQTMSSSPHIVSKAPSKPPPPHNIIKIISDGQHILQGHQIVRVPNTGNIMIAQSLIRQNAQAQTIRPPFSLLSGPIRAPTQTQTIGPNQSVPRMPVAPRPRSNAQMTNIPQANIQWTYRPRTKTPKTNIPQTSSHMTTSPQTNSSHKIIQINKTHQQMGLINSRLRTLIPKSSASVVQLSDLQALQQTIDFLPVSVGASLQQNPGPSVSDPDLSTVTPIEITPIEIAPIEGYDESVVCVKQEKPNRWSSNLVIDLDNELDSPNANQSAEQVVDKGPLSLEQQIAEFNIIEKLVVQNHQIDNMSDCGVSEKQMRNEKEVNTNMEPILTGSSVDNVASLGMEGDLLRDGSVPVAAGSLTTSCDKTQARQNESDSNPKESDEQRKVPHHYVRTNKDGSIEVVVENVLESELLKRQADLSMSMNQSWDLDSADEEDPEDNDITSGHLPKHVTMPVESMHNNDIQTSLQGQQKGALSSSTKQNIVTTESVPETYKHEIVIHENEINQDKCIKVMNAKISTEVDQATKHGRSQPKVQSIGSITVATELDERTVKQANKVQEAVQITGTIMPSEEICTDIGSHIESTFPCPRIDESLRYDCHIENEDVHNMSNGSSSPALSEQKTTCKQKRDKTPVKKKLKQVSKRKSGNINDKRCLGKVRTVSTDELIQRSYIENGSNLISLKRSSTNFDSKCKMKGQVVFARHEWEAAENDPIFQPIVTLRDVNKQQIQWQERPSPPLSPVDLSDEEFTLPKSRLYKLKVKSVPTWSPNKRKLLTARKSISKGGMLLLRKGGKLSHPSFALSTTNKSLSFTTTTLPGSMNNLCGSIDGRANSPSSPVKDIVNDVLPSIISKNKAMNENEESKIKAINENEEISSVSQTTTDTSEVDATTTTCTIEHNTELGVSQMVENKEKLKTLSKSVKSRKASIKRKAVKGPSKATKQTEKSELSKDDTNSSSGNESYIPKKRRREKVEKIMPVRRGRSLAAFIQENPIEVPTDKLGYHLDVNLSLAEGKKIPDGKKKKANKKVSVSNTSQEKVTPEPFFDPQIPLLREDSTYIERTMYKPEIPGILDITGDQSTVNKDVTKPNVTKADVLKMDKPKPKVLEAPMDDSSFLAILKSRLLLAKTETEAETLKTTIASLFPDTIIPNTKPESVTKTEPKSTIPVKLDDFDYSDEVHVSEKTKSILKSDLPEELNSAEVDNSVTLIKSFSNEPCEGLKVLQDERWTILHALEGIAEEEQKNKKRSECKHKKKKSIRVEETNGCKREKNKEHKNLKAIMNAEINVTSQKDNTEETRISEHKSVEDQKSDEVKLMEINDSSHNTNDKDSAEKKIDLEIDIKSCDDTHKNDISIEKPGTSVSKHRKRTKSASKNHRRNSDGNDFLKKSKRKLYTDSEVIKKIIAHKESPRKEAQNIFAGDEVNTGPVVQWMNEIDHITQIPQEQSSNVLEQIIASTKEPLKDTEIRLVKDTEITHVKDKDAIDTENSTQNIVGKEQTSRNQGVSVKSQDSSTILKKPVQKENKAEATQPSSCQEKSQKEKPKKVKVDINTYFARAAEKRRTSLSKDESNQQKPTIIEETTIDQIVKATVKEMPIDIPDLDTNDIRKILETVHRNDKVMSMRNVPSVPSDVKVKAGLPIPDRQSASSKAQDAIGFRIRYLQENIESVCLKRKELIADMNLIKRKLSSKLESDGRNKLEQEACNLECFIVGLYIDEDIIKRELDKVRGNVKGQPNQPVPASLLLPDELVLLQTQNKIPLILMSKLLSSQYDNLSALKVDFEALNAQWRNTNVLDSSKSRRLQDNYTFVKDHRYRILTTLCKAKDMKHTAKKYYEELNYYRKWRDPFYKEYKKNMNPCTKDRMQYIDTRISELDGHINLLCKVLILPRETLRSPKRYEKKLVKQEAQAQTASSPNENNHAVKDGAISSDTTRGDIVLNETPAMKDLEKIINCPTPITMEMPPWLKNRKKLLDEPSMHEIIGKAPNFSMGDKDYRSLKGKLTVPKPRKGSCSSNSFDEDQTLEYKKSLELIDGQGTEKDKDGTLNVTQKPLIQLDVVLEVKTGNVQSTSKVQLPLNQLSCQDVPPMNKKSDDDTEFSELVIDLPETCEENTEDNTDCMAAPSKQVISKLPPVITQEINNDLVLDDQRLQQETTGDSPTISELPDCINKNTVTEKKQTAVDEVTRSCTALPVTGLPQETIVDVEDAPALSSFQSVQSSEDKTESCTVNSKDIDNYSSNISVKMTNTLNNGITEQELSTSPPVSVNLSSPTLDTIGHKCESSKAVKNRPKTTLEQNANLDKSLPKTAYSCTKSALRPTLSPKVRPVEPDHRRTALILTKSKLPKQISFTDALSTATSECQRKGKDKKSSEDMKSPVDKKSAKTKDIVSKKVLSTNQHESLGTKTSNDEHEEDVDNFRRSTEFVQVVKEQRMNKDTSTYIIETGEQHPEESLPDSRMEVNDIYLKTTVEKRKELLQQILKKKNDLSKILAVNLHAEEFPNEHVKNIQQDVLVIDDDTDDESSAIEISNCSTKNTKTNTFKNIKGVNSALSNNEISLLNDKPSLVQPTVLPEFEPDNIIEAPEKEIASKVKTNDVIPHILLSGSPDTLSDKEIHVSLTNTHRPCDIEELDRPQRKTDPIIKDKISSAEVDALIASVRQSLENDVLRGTIESEDSAPQTTSNLLDSSQPMEMATDSIETPWDRKRKAYLKARYKSDGFRSSDHDDGFEQSQNYSHRKSRHGPSFEVYHPSDEERNKKPILQGAEEQQQNLRKAYDSHQCDSSVKHYKPMQCDKTSRRNSRDSRDGSQHTSSQYNYSHHVQHSRSRSPQSRSPGSISPRPRSPRSRSPRPRSPRPRSPRPRSPRPRSPRSRSPRHRSPRHRSPRPRLPRSPRPRSPRSRSPRSRSPKSRNRPRSPRQRSQRPRSPRSISPRTRRSRSPYNRYEKNKANDGQYSQPWIKRENIEPVSKGYDRKRTNYDQDWRTSRQSQDDIRRIVPKVFDADQDHRSKVDILVHDGDRDYRRNRIHGFNKDVDHRNGDGDFRRQDLHSSDYR